MNYRVFLAFFAGSFVGLTAPVSFAVPAMIMSVLGIVVSAWMCTPTEDANGFQEWLEERKQIPDIDTPDEDANV